MEFDDVNKDSEVLRQLGVEISFVEGKKNVLVENEGWRYYRSEVQVKIDEKNLSIQEYQRAGEVLAKFKNYTFSIWSIEKVSSMEEVVATLKEDGAFFGECGLASNPDQFDNETCSTVVSLNNEANERRIKKKMFLGFSCPGFGGSSLKDDEVSEENVGIESYLQINNFMLDTLGVNVSKSVLLGHSAGGEKALGMSSRLRVVALNPAVHEEEDKVFGGLEFPNSIAKLFRTEITSSTVDYFVDKVVKYNVGATEAMLVASNNLAMNAQVANHREEIKNNFKAYIAKSKELIRPDVLRNYGGNPMVVVGGRADRLTPWDKALESIKKMIGEKGGVKVVSEEELGVDKLHHDTVFMNKEANAKVAKMAWDLLDLPMVEERVVVEKVPVAKLVVAELPQAREYDGHKEKLDILFRWEMFALEAKGWVDLIKSGSDQKPTTRDFVEAYDKWILSYEPIAEIIERKKLDGSGIATMVGDLFTSVDKVYDGVKYPMFSFFGQADTISEMQTLRIGLGVLAIYYGSWSKKGDVGSIDFLVSALEEQIVPFVERKNNGGKIGLSPIELAIKSLEK